MTNFDDLDLLELPDEDDFLILSRDLHRYFPIDPGALFQLSFNEIGPPYMHLAGGCDNCDPCIAYRIGDLRRWLFRLLFPYDPEPKTRAEKEQSYECP